MSFSILISLFNLVVMITQIKQTENNLIHFILYKFHLGRAFIYKQMAGYLSSQIIEAFYRQKNFKLLTFTFTSSFFPLLLNILFELQKSQGNNYFAYLLDYSRPDKLYSLKRQLRLGKVFISVLFCIVFLSGFAYISPVEFSYC